MPSLSQLVGRRLPLSADSVEWCPVEGFQRLLACATYELIDESSLTGQRRRGCIHLLELQSDNLVELWTTDTAGILDCKWSRHRIWGHVYLAAVDANSRLLVYKLDESSKSLVELHSVNLSNGTNPLLLSLDWSNVLFPGGSTRIVASDSEGGVHVVELTLAGSSTLLSTKLHQFEAWIAAFNYFDTNVVYSGGDDCRLRAHDMRANGTIMTSKEHTAGVTSIQFNWRKEHSFVTGSYDERLLFWDCRAWQRPLSEVKAPGGIWRIKHEPVDCSLLALPCMYGGSAVVDGRHEPAIAATYDCHDSINYGIDWCWETSERPVLAVCSFYDKFLSLATYDSV